MGINCPDTQRGRSIYLGGFKYKYFLFVPLLGEMIQFDEHIFADGWLNHQQV